jgi:hypothetical protein
VDELAVDGHGVVAADRHVGLIGRGADLGECVADFPPPPVSAFARLTNLLTGSA